MTRALALLSMFGGFLAISPKLRDGLIAGFASANSGLETYSPYSYIALVLGAFATVVVVFNRSAAPH